jgi:SAM-dependent methyltransferase
MPHQSLTDPTSVARQYATTENLDTRRAVWGPGPGGVSPVDLLRDTVLDCRPGRVLEIGCGTGRFATSVIDAAPSVDYVATDASPAMVEATLSRGVQAQRADAESLPFPDDSFDAVVAAWMLYHVSDLDGALREARRVLRPGGTFAVATNGDRHLAGLLGDAGGSPLVTQFSSENGGRLLREHFEDVSRQDVTTWASLPDHAAAAAYLATFDSALARALPPFTGARRYDGFTTVFTAR